LGWYHYRLHEDFSVRSYVMGISFQEIAEKWMYVPGFNIVVLRRNRVIGAIFQSVLSPKATWGQA
jgi:hypothetical protein